MENFDLEKYKENFIGLATVASQATNKVILDNAKTRFKIA
jgi:hypothetical protein